ncbi:hypothetical protein [Pseudomonas sp. GXZC]|uniref:hypothetical protein n=1 Tax=Pseudomonas sp. GXZC TaxID=3003351 RepID=UPI0022AAE702|nr:hypothetical protein [Pseudomonas sp. GXZC]WAT26292.1 hypothetical protein OZ428_20150 [Pseudomonas sp. GXZC]
MSDEPFSLSQLYQAIEQHLTEHLSGIKSVVFWPEIEENRGIPLPSVFLEMAEFEPGIDTGTGESSLICKFEARVIVDPIQANHHEQAVHLVSQLAVLLRQQSWGLEVNVAQFVRATQDWTKPELDGYVVWVVEWTHHVYLGAEVWPFPAEKPSMLKLNLEAYRNDDNPGGAP